VRLAVDGRKLTQELVWTENGEHDLAPIFRHRRILDPTSEASPSTPIERRLF
jgi:hypothetical protein